MTVHIPDWLVTIGWPALWFVAGWICCAFMRWLDNETRN
jgi:hypothetical protein